MRLYRNAAIESERSAYMTPATIMVTRHLIEMVPDIGGCQCHSLHHKTPNRRWTKPLPRFVRVKRSVDARCLRKCCTTTCPAKTPSSGWRPLLKTPQHKRECLKRTLAINPQNSIARRKLRSLGVTAPPVAPALAQRIAGPAYGSPSLPAAPVAARTALRKLMQQTGGAASADRFYAYCRTVPLRDQSESR